MKLYTKLAVMTIILIMLTLTISGVLVGKWEFRRFEASMEKDLMNVSRTLSESEIVQNGLKSGRSEEIQAYVKRLLNTLDEVDIITVADMESIRYGHPNDSRIGQRFVGGDEVRVIEEGVSYVSVATGTLGRSLRAFAPVYSGDEQVGFVMTGHMYNSVLAQRRQMEKNFAIYAFWGTFLGSIGAFFISRSIKKSLLNLEPSEIARLYRNQEGILSAAREGIIAIDANKNITLVNQSAIEILGGAGENVVGRPVQEVFPDTGLVRVMETGEAEIGRERAFAGTHILANRIPILEDGRIVGAMATFLDRTEFTKMAEEVTGVNIILDALRANAHEFRNKIHVLLGLLQLEEYDRARAYIRDVESDNENIRRMVSGKIKNATMGALLLGKYNRAKEEGIELHLTEDSRLEADCGVPDDALIVVLGNLIENAIEAISRAQIESGEIQVYISSIDDEVVCQVRDNGPGMLRDQIERSFDRGVTTKLGSAGIGLDLVAKTLELYEGTITLESEPGQGIEATAVFKRGK